MRRRGRARARYRNYGKKKLAWVSVTDAGTLNANALGLIEDTIAFLNADDWETINSANASETCTVLRVLFHYAMSPFQDGTIIRVPTYHLIMHTSEADATTPGLGFNLQDFLNTEDVMFHDLHLPDWLYNVDTAPTQYNFSTRNVPYDIRVKRKMTGDRQLRLTQRVDVGLNSATSGIHFNAVYRTLIQIG